jgi:hypothetical protein
LFLAFAAVAGCATRVDSVSTLPDRCALGGVVDTAGPTKEVFYREVLFAAATYNTARFDAYGPTGYGVDKLQMAAELPAVADTCGVDLDGLVVLGPTGTLWTYRILAFLRDGDAVRVNFLMYPHARITGKAVRTLPQADVGRWFDEILSLPYISPGLPVLPDSITDELAREFWFDFFAVRWDEDGAKYWYAQLDEVDNVEELQERYAEFQERYAEMVRDMVDTYIHHHRR